MWWSKTLLVGCFLAGAWSLSAQTPEEKTPGILFLETEPFGAYVRLQQGLEPDRFLTEKTPALVKGLNPGEWVVDVWKEGHAAVQQTLRLAPGEIKVLKVTLLRNSVPVLFPAEEQIKMGSRTSGSPGTQFLLDYGDYKISREEGLTKISPIFPEENLWLVSALGLGLATVWAGGATYQDLENPWNQKFPLSPLTFGAYAALVADAGWFVSLTLRKLAHESAFKSTSAPARYAPMAVDLLYQKGEKALVEGEFEKAAEAFLQVIEYYPDSSLSAEALFRLGRVHTLFGRFAQAETEYSLIVDEYPLSSIWDRAQKALSDLAVMEEKWDKALGHLDNILFVDPLIQPEDVQSSRSDIMARKGGVE